MKNYSILLRFLLTSINNKLNAQIIEAYQKDSA
jgi:hypothetical protein